MTLNKDEMLNFIETGDITDDSWKESAEEAKWEDITEDNPVPPGTGRQLTSGTKKG